MPKGFLIKRNKNFHPFSYRRSREDEEHSYVGVNQECKSRDVGSPDSGYSQSPLPLTVKYSGHFDSYSHLQISQVGSLSPIRPDNALLQSLTSLSPQTVPETARCISSAPAAPCAALTKVQPGTNLEVRCITTEYTGVTAPIYINRSDFKSAADDSLQVTDLSMKSRDKCMEINDATYANNNNSIKRKQPLSKPKSASKPVVPCVSKAVRKIDFEIDTTSPVSGTIIKCDSDFEDEGIHVTGDIDSALNFVEVTPEARAELDKIENKIGDYICQLCKEKYPDAFQLAQHRCSRIVHIEYRCPECGKVFNCPANLASHRRWHKPRQENPKPHSTKILPSSARGSDGETDHERSTPSPSLGGKPPANPKMFFCEHCGKKFRRQAFLQKHRLSHHGAWDTKSNVKIKNCYKESSCKVCESNFPTKTALEKHMRQHTREAFPCKYCSNTFFSSPGLTRHINKCHPSENKQIILLKVPVEHVY